MIDTTAAKFIGAEMYPLSKEIILAPPNTGKKKSKLPDILHVWSFLLIHDSLLSIQPSSLRCREAISASKDGMAEFSGPGHKSFQQVVDLPNAGKSVLEWLREKRQRQV